MKSTETTSKPTITWPYNLENTKVMAMSIDIGEKEDVSSDTKITGESLVENCKFIVLRKQLSRMCLLTQRQKNLCQPTHTREMRNQMQRMFKLAQEREFVLISIEHGRHDTNKKTLEFMLTYT
jgi:hypothetical protein